MSTFESLEKLHPLMIRDGIRARAVNGERLTIAVVDLEPNVALPEHHHDNEQLGFVIDGTITMRIGPDKKLLRAGDVYVIPSQVPHAAHGGPEGCTVTEVLAPVRQDWAKLERGEPSPGRWP
jgi:quercetin dioxygenase-like cupin family protein